MKIKQILGFVFLVLFVWTLIGCDARIVEVSFQTNGGDRIEKIQLEQGELLEEVPEATRAGHTFIRWYEDAEFTIEFNPEKQILRNITIYAKWQINQYTITIHTDGGPALENITADYQTTLSIPEDITKEGYTFLGWYLDSEFTQTFQYSRMPAENIDIYARWAIDVYTVTFYVGDSVYTTRSVEHGDDITNIPTVPAVTGKSGTWDITDFTNITEDMTVHAVYTDKTYEVVIKDEWGTVYDTQIVIHGNTIVAPTSNPEKEGYTFIGYSEDLDTFVVTENVEIQVTFQIITLKVQFFGFQGEPLGLQNVSWGSNATAPNISIPNGYTFGGWDKPFTNVTTDLMVYAEFTPNQYDIVFHAGSGVFTNQTNTRTLTAPYTSVIGTQEVPELTGFTFVGWYENPEFTGNAFVFSAQSTMPLNGLELYAKYQANNYTITFDAAGGTVSPASKGVTYQQSIGTLPIPVKTGYTFLHWVNDAQEVITSSAIYEVEGNTTLTAIYEIKQYTVNFVVDGVTLDTLTVDYQTVLHSLDIPVIPTKAHYTDTTPTWSIHLDGYVVTSNLTVQAVYVANVYTITFDTVGGLPLMDSISLAYNSTITAPSNPTKEGFSFGGWFIESETEPFIFDKMPGGDITLFALWTEWPVIDLVLNGGTGVMSISKAPLSEIQAPAAPTKPGYTFAGWYLDNGTFTNSYTFTIMPEENLTVYAKWDIDFANYTVKLFYQNIDGVTYPSQASNTLTLNAYSESLVTYTPEGVEGFTFESSLSVLSGVVVGDGSLVLEVYYSRNLQQVTLNYQDHSDAANETIVTIHDLVFGSPMTFLDNHPSTRTGYTFIEWRDITGNVYDTVSVIPGDVELYAIWSLNTFGISGKHIFEKEDLTTQAITSDGDDIVFSLMNVAYGTEYSPVEFFEGYEFHLFEYNGVEYHNVSDVLTVSEDLTNIEVVYRRKVLTITFIQNPETAGGPAGIVEDTFQVHYNESFTGTLPTLQYNASTYAATWDRNVFLSLRNDVVVRAMYYELGVQTVTFMDNGIIRYIATETGENQIITTSSPLWNLSKPGHRFLGWFDQASGGNKLEITDLIFTNFGDTDYVYAQWQALNAFNVPSDVDISTNFEDEITITWTLDPVQIESTSPSGFVVLLNGVEIEVLLTEVVINQNQVTLHVTELDDLFGSLSVLLLPGVHTVSIKVLGDNTNHLDSNYSESYQYSVDTEIEGEVTDVAVYDYFIVESVEINNVPTKRYVFYTDMTYNFSEKYQFEILNGQEFVQANQNQLILLNQPGNFRFTMSIDGGLPVVYEGRVVKNINQFAVGNNYATYLNQTNVEESDYLRQTTSSYQVGYRNPFYFDLRMIDNNGNRVSLTDVMLEYDFYLDDATTPLTKIELEDYVEFLPYNQLQFKPLASGHTFDVVVAPRYQATKMAVDHAEFSFVVNDGYNAFNNQQLKLLFSNLNVNTINIQANIQAELSSNQVNADGSPKNRYVYPQESDTLGNVYARVDDQTTSDNFTINGNYMTIDGSELPYSNKDSGSGVVGYAASFEIINVQVGIFYYNMANLSSSLPEENNNRFTVENLTILGNTSTPQVNYGQSAEEIINQEQLMSKNSGGYLGIVVRNGSSYIENVRVGFTLIAFTNNAYGQDANTIPVNMTINYVEMFDQWANSMYAYGATGFTILNSKIGQSGGAAIHMVDAKVGSGLANPELTIDDATEINNWISGDEAWFKAYGMSAIALQLKASIQNAVTGAGKSIIKNIVNPVTGLESERINFVMLTEPSNGAVDDVNYPTSGSEIKLSLMTDVIQTSIERPFNFLSSPDPRIQGGQFMFPVGMYSDTMAFIAAYQEAVSYGVPAQDAPNIVYIAGFYNLTVLEAIQSYTYAVTNGIPLPIVVEQNKGTSHVLPKYLEINTPVPLFTSGYSVVLLEVFNQTYE